jgi:DNA-binding Lrp family transcriptional regulator
MLGKGRDSGVGVDETDKKIIALLKEDARMHLVQVGKEIGLTEGAVRARIVHMLASGEIERFTIDVKEDICTIVMVAVASGTPTTKAATAIRKLGVNKVYEVSGNYDIICFISAPSVPEANSIVEKIRKIDGVTDTNTNVVFK